MSRSLVKTPTAMVTVNRSWAKAHLSGLPDRLEAGEEVLITRHGRAVAHFQSVLHQRRPPALEDLAMFRTGMPRLRRSNAGLLREARDEGL